MATPKLLLSKLLRRCPPTLNTISLSRLLSCSSISSLYSIFLAQSSNSATQGTIISIPSSTLHPLALHYSFLCSRSFSTRDAVYGGDLCPDSATQPEEEVEELSGLGFSSDSGGGGGDKEVAEALLSVSSAAIDGDGESILPVPALISLLDWYHDSTGWPWWVVIASSTLALRITLLPVLILQLKKLKKIAESFPKSPPPSPPPLSGRSVIDLFSLFRKERRAIGSPSYLWLLAYVSVQVPCFLLWMTTVRRMSLDHHPGFDCGGTLWFQNLTEFPCGVLGFIFPLLIASLHFVNVQISFRTSSAAKRTGLFGLLAQGSLVYWVTNSSLTLVQQLSLNQPGVREKLGLLDKVDPVPTANCEEMDKHGETQGGLIRKPQEILVHHLSPQELLVLSVKHLAECHEERAMPLLRLALDKDPEYVRALVVMGQTLLQNGELAEATDYLERAISKLFLMGHPTEVEEVDLVILASQWAGISCIRQGRNAEGIRHLERVTNLPEPEDMKSKGHYYDVFVLLASALYNEGRKVEAAKYLRMVAAYDSSYNVFLEQCEKDEVNIVSDLVSSRRGDF